jgi:hypothetical protein
MTLLTSLAFGLRHLIYSVAAMPETANPLINVVICETDFSQLLRTIISLHIMVSWRQDPEENTALIAEIVSHVWYSLKWPQELHSYVKDTVGNGALEAREHVRSSRDSGTVRTPSVTFGEGRLQLHAQLEPDVWDAIVNQIYQTSSKNERTARMARETDAMLYGEPLDRVHARMSPSRAAALMKWRQDGILMPYSSPTEAFVKPSP